MPVRWLALVAALISGACAAAPRLDRIRLPPGFRISVYADQVKAARSLALGERGTLFVGSSGGDVYAIPADGGAAVVVASGLQAPHGVAFRDGSLYVAEIGRVLRYGGIESRLRNPPQPRIVTQDLPSHRHHGFKTIGFAPDGMLYLSTGSPCNICEPGEQFGTISRLDPSSGKREIHARGIRNSVGFDWDPRSRELWFTDNPHPAA